VGHWEKYDVTDGLGASSVISIVQDREGALWFGSQGGGVSRYDGKRFHTFSSDANFQVMCLVSAFIDEVKHKTFVAVKEEGTEAAAVTVVGMTKGVSGTMEMVIDRPFFCAIRDNGNGAILFMGSIVDP
jgi:hypothetical protein